LATQPSNPAEPWRKRLNIPAYQIGEAARYARISSQTVTAWHKIDKRVLPEKRSRERLSYLQLIELAVVAAFRKAKFQLGEIRAARNYVKQTLKSDHPFAEFEFKRYGKSLFTEYEEASGHRKLVKANQAGQLA
jgi:DNA-binding transcriptional MerR regulator